VRFDRFEVDLRRGELRRDGVAVGLQDKPLQLLLALLESPNTVVSREELYKHLWQTDTFVGFDEGLNTAIRKLRQTLNDSAEMPRIIETVPKKGYRFIAKVEFVVPPKVPASDSQNSTRHKSLRNLAIAAGVTLSLAAASLVTLQLSRKTSTEFSSVVVLPLEQLSGDAIQEYFADGMTDALITDLAKISSLRVISRTSAMHFRGTHLTARQIADQLGVEAVVEGSVTRAGNRVRITAQLIDARRDRHLWAESYDGEMNDILTLQNTVAESIARHVQANLSRGVGRKFNTSRTVNAAAYEEFLQGRYYWAKFTQSGWQKALEHFEVAIARDPNYAPAYVGLADSYEVLGAYQYMSMRQAMPLATAALRKALELDPDFGEAHYSLGAEKTAYEYDWEGAEAEFQKGLALNPNYAIGRMWHSFLLSALSRHEEAIAEQIRARALDPVSLVINTNLCRAYVFARRPEDAIRACKHTLELDSHFGFAYGWLSVAYQEQGRTEEAFQEDQNELETDNQRTLMQLRLLRHRRGEDRVLAVEELKQAIEQYANNSLGASDIAAMYAALNKPDKAFEYLYKAYDARESALSVINVSPVWDPLRSDPRFHSMLLRMNLVK
jgi:TolB-like protein/DNA-binding winged helix-turn-helix (wHTH) protein/Tfp pilus assembly protein PilF